MQYFEFCVGCKWHGSLSPTRKNAHSIFCFIIIIFPFKNKIIIIKQKNMSAEITYLINLHKEGKIDDSALNKALNALQPASAQTVESDVQSTASGFEIAYCINYI